MSAAVLFGIFATHVTGFLVQVLLMTLQNSPPALDNERDRVRFSKVSISPLGNTQQFFPNLLFT